MKRNIISVIKTFFVILALALPVLGFKSVEMTPVLANEPTTSDVSDGQKNFTLREKDNSLVSLLELLGIKGEIKSIVSSDTNKVTVDLENKLLIAPNPFTDTVGLTITSVYEEEEIVTEITLDYKEPQVFVSDLLLIGRNYDSKTDIFGMFKQKGYTGLSKDLNAGAGKKTNYINLGYKTTTDYSNAIKDIIIMDGHYYRDDARATIEYDGRTYTRCAVDGDWDFRNSKGDLNASAGGSWLYLYYTKEDYIDDRGITNIWIDNKRDDCVSGFDLNRGAGGDYIYLHRTKADRYGNNVDSKDYTYIKEFMVAGDSKKDNAKNQLWNRGYSVIDYDLNNWAGGLYVYLGFKTTRIYDQAIKDVRINLYPRNNNKWIKEFTDAGRKYTLASYVGNKDFNDSWGDLNCKAGGSWVYLFSTIDKNGLEDSNAVIDLWVNKDRNGAVSNVDLNSNAGGEDLFLHILKQNMADYSLAKDKNPVYISDILLVGYKNYDDVKEEMNKHPDYKFIDYDLNSNAGGHYIYLGYKTTQNYSEAIKDIVIKKGKDNAKDSIEINKIKYNLAPLAGDSSFISAKGDLNLEAGGKYLYLFYTKTETNNQMAIRSLEINNEKSNSLNTTDLNDGAGGDYIYLHARRLNKDGYSYVNEINDADWMSFVPDDVKITNLTIPGAHDAGSCHTSAIWPVSHYTLCQGHHIGNQVYKDNSLLRSNRNVTDIGLLQRGVRYLDIRYGLIKDSSVSEDDSLANASSHLKLVHGGFTCQYKTSDNYLYFDAFGSYETTTNDKLMKWCKEFLTEHPTETIILDLSTDDGKNSADAEKWAAKFYSRQAVEKDPRYPEIYVGDHVPTLGECRGKLVLLADFNTSYFVGDGDEVWAFKNAYGIGNEKDWTYGEVVRNNNLKYVIYKNNKYDDGKVWISNAFKKQWILNGLNSAQSFRDQEYLGNNRTDAFLLLYTSMNNITTGDVLGSPAILASDINVFTERNVKMNKSGFYGIVAMDFINDTIREDNVSKTLWSTNFYRSFTISDSVVPVLPPVEEFTMEKAKITFDSNGGNGEMDIQILDSNNQILDLNAFKREGYKFLGWSTSLNGPVEYQSLSKIYVTSDENAAVPADSKRLLLTDGSETTLYAVWERSDVEPSSTSSSKWKDILRISIAILAILSIGAGLFLFKRKTHA